MTTKTYIHQPTFTLIVILLFTNLFGIAQLKPSYVDFDAYEKLVAEVKEHRKSRLLTAEEFIKTSKQDKVLILDTRSDSMYNAAHVKGAIHLNFSDFTQDNLAKIIPSPDYKILIYCNNNFETAIPSVVSSVAPTLDLRDYFATKVSKPMPAISLDLTPKPTKTSYKKTKTKQKGPNNETVVDIIPENKPITLALNIPTYINLYGYGYKNVYELSELVDVNSGILEFEGTAIKK